jgi:hypothetical protein
MLSLRKISQDISFSTCKWIPLIPLDKEWNDNDVYKYFNLSENEIKLINETNINGYKNIKIPLFDTIKDGRKHYYLINNELYKIKKDKTQGEFIGNYIEGKIILLNKKHPK